MWMENHPLGREGFMIASRLFRAAIACAAIAVPAGAHAQARAASPQPADAQAIRAEIEQLKNDFNARLAALEERLAALGVPPAPPGGTAAPSPQAPAAGAPEVPGATATAEVPAGAQGSGGPQGALPVYGNVSAGSKMFNPDAAVIGNFIGAGGKNDVHPLPALALPESELSLQAIVDPYARADFFLSFGEEGVDIEEGVLTFPALPGGLLMKVGKQRAAFGKVNTLHRHILPWADRPLVTDNLLGGEEGISDAGVSVARLIPNPWLFLEATGQVYRGDSADVFQSNKRGDLGYVGHLRGYQDITESTNIDVGASYARGHNSAGVVGGIDVGRFTTDLFGIDATLRWRPLQRSIYHSFLGRGEVIWSRREQFGGTASANGFYVSGDYQLGRRWFTGLRFDRSDRADDGSADDAGMSWTVTYWPSEFSQVRGQLRHTRYAEGSDANEVLFQFQFAIGAHGAHPF
jgi:hypothetical protein